MIDLRDYQVAGYFLIKANKPDWPQLKTELLPEKLLSLSDCICPRLSVWWGWQPGDKDAALNFGIPPSKLDEFVDWCTQDYEAVLEPGSAFRSIDAAREFVQRFLPDTSSVYLIGAGLHHTLTDHFGQETKHLNVPHTPLEEGGIVLGFEVVAHSHGFSDSWLCSGLEGDMHRLFGICPNQYGLINTYAEAKQVYDWIAEDKQQGTRAEPLPYYIWLLVSYPIPARSA